MAGFIRREFPGITIILGGGLVTSWVRNPGWKNPFSGLVDHLVAGPGEDRFLSLLGLTAGIKRTWRPDYAGLPAGRYLSPGFILPYSASSGCYWGRCDFCPEKAEKNVYAPIPSRQVIADLKAMRKDSDPALIHLLDNAVSPALLEALSSEPIGAPWYGFARISEYLTDPDVCRALKRSGCVMLKLGIESGAQDVLDCLEKGISVRTASMVLKNLKRAGIASYVYLLFGTPVETETSARKTLDFAVQHHECINFLNLAIFNMPVCGQAGQGIERKNFYDGDLSLYTDFVHPQGWDRRQVRLFLDDTFRKHPSISSILRNEPPVFTSNHAAFLVMNEKERK